MKTRRKSPATPAVAPLPPPPELGGRRVLVVGLGESGLAMVRHLCAQQAQPRVCDTRAEPPALAALRERHPSVPFSSGGFEPALLENTDLLAWSPGVSIERGPGAAFYALARERGLPVLGELDLFMHALARLHLAELAAHALRQAEHLAAQEAEQAEQARQQEARSQAAADLAAALDEATPADDAKAAPPADAVGQQAGEPAGEESAWQDEAESPPLSPPDDAPRPARVLAVTGTNGKTTVTALTARLLEAAGVSAVAAGNIGPAMLDALHDALESQSLPTVWVLELSSFQLAIAAPIRPDAAAILNVSQDHLDWHESMQTYVRAKHRIAGPTTVLVHWRGDPACRAEGAGGYASFGLDAPTLEGETGLVHDGGFPWLAEAVSGDDGLPLKRGQSPEPARISRLMPVDVLQIQGAHNHLNAMAALALCRAIGTPVGAMLHALGRYRGEPHRCQHLATLDGVDWYDDSKGTNVGATVAALQGLGRRCWLIAGGQGKGQDFSPLAQAVARHAAGVLLIGEDAPRIESLLQHAGIASERCATLEQAVARAAAQARDGEAVLLSPACASFDMFRSYRDRGERFARAVRELAGERGNVLELPC
ncbi:MAG: UDP-N-acetylmuramoyl-L-alanine--D-glutamate ligase [Burkholderiaceae bacterium]